MSDLFKSAMGYFGSTNNGAVDNEFVGQIVEIGDEKFRIKRVIAEGMCLFYAPILIFNIKNICFLLLIFRWVCICFHCPK